MQGLRARTGQEIQRAGHHAAQPERLGQPAQRQELAAGHQPRLVKPRQDRAAGIEGIEAVARAGYLTAGIAFQRHAARQQQGLWRQKFADRAAQVGIVFQRIFDRRFGPDGGCGLRMRGKALAGEGDQLFDAALDAPRCLFFALPNVGLHQQKGRAADRSRGRAGNRLHAEQQRKHRDQRPARSLSAPRQQGRQAPGRQDDEARKTDGADERGQRRNPRQLQPRRAQRIPREAAKQDAPQHFCQHEKPGKQQRQRHDLRRQPARGISGGGRIEGKEGSQPDNRHPAHHRRHGGLIGEGGGDPGEADAKMRPAEQEAGQKAVRPRRQQQQQRRNAHNRRGDRFGGGKTGGGKGAGERSAKAMRPARPARDGLQNGVGRGLRVHACGYRRRPRAGQGKPPRGNSSGCSPKPILPRSSPRSSWCDRSWG